jgi:hypothetical protein
VIEGFSESKFRLLGVSAKRRWFFAFFFELILTLRGLSDHGGRRASQMIPLTARVSLSQLFSL